MDHCAVIWLDRVRPLRLHGRVSYAYFSKSACTDVGPRRGVFSWFHFECVGLKHKPREKWYCSAECRIADK